RAISTYNLVTSFKLMNPKLSKTKLHKLLGFLTLSTTSPILFLVQSTAFVPTLLILSKIPPPPLVVPLLNLGTSPKCFMKWSYVALPLCTLYPFFNGTIVSDDGVNERFPLLSSIISCLNPPGPFPRPLSPTTASVSLLILPLVT